jgi:hypothetical protein
MCLSEFLFANITEIYMPILIRALWCVSILSMYSTCIVTLILNITVHRKLFPLILRRICIIDSKLFNDGRNEKSYKSRRSGTTKQLTVIAIIWIINCVSNFYSFFNVEILNIISLSLRILCNIIFFLISYQYTSMVLVLRARYKHLVSMFSNLLIIEGNLYDSNLTHISNSGSPGACLMFCGNTRNIVVSQIVKLRHIYCQLHDVLLLFNKYYGIPVLLLVIATVINFIPTLFLGIIFIRIFIMGYRELIMYMMIESHLFWCISTLFIFVWINSCCHLVTEEVHRLLLCIHKIQIYSNVTQSTIRELRSFVSQLKDMRVEFSVCGLFTLNLPFLCATLGIITTYVVVLFQLK